MGRYQAYPDYKNSDCKWVDKIPSAWRMSPLKALVEIVNGSTPKSDVEEFWDGDIPWITPADMGKKNSPFIEYGARNITVRGYESCGTSIVPAGSIVLSSRAPIGTLAIALNDLCTNQGCKSLLVSDKVNNKFLYYSLHCSTKPLNILGRGTTFLELSTDELARFVIPTPSIFEQEAIANFLDHETAKIDTLIEKQQQLIQLLKEKRQAVISHAVTKGLNPDAPMKDSGVEWLGQVPAHWEVTRAKYVSEIFVPQRNKPELNEESGTPWATMEDMKNSYIESTNYYVSDDSAKFSGSKKLRSGSVIASCVGNFGIASINLVDLIINQQLQAFVPKKIKAGFLREIVSISKSYFELIGTAATLVYVNQQGFENLPVIVPLLSEQEDICTFLEAEAIKFDSLIKKAERAITLMQERRTALISAAVTGKIDVRN
jgi:type I restriction enzyme S subunit